MDQVKRPRATRDRALDRLRAGARGAALASVALLLASCRDTPPLEQMEGARRALAAAGKVEGLLRVPEVCAAAQADLARAESEIRMQDKRSAWSRSYGDARLLAARALAAGQICAAHARAEASVRRDRAEAALRDLQDGITRAEILARHAPDGEGLKDGLLRATLALGEGRTSFGLGRYERAEEAAARGRALVRQSVDDIDRFIENFRRNPRLPQWRRWVAETVKESRSRNRTVILVDKLRRQMLLVRGDDDVASYLIDIGLGGMESKTRAGDASTPEGRYKVTEIRGPGQTRYHRALVLDYPNEEDVAHFKAMKRAGTLPRGGTIGGNIEIHGSGGRERDWTQGCVAMSDDDIDDLVQQVEVGTPVTIVGTIPEGVLP